MLVEPPLLPSRKSGGDNDKPGVAISQGGLANLVAAARAAFAAQAARLREQLPEAAVLASDETGLRVEGTNAWLWVVHHRDSALFRVDPSRGKRVLAAILGSHPPDFWLSHRYGGQMGFPTRGHQLCLAHLIRDAQYAISASDTGFAPAFLALLRRACHLGAIRETLSDRQLANRQRRLVGKRCRAWGSRLPLIGSGRARLFLCAAPSTFFDAGDLQSGVSIGAGDPCPGTRPAGRFRNLAGESG